MLFRSQSRTLALLLAVILAAADLASAMETDQFTTPRMPMHDIGSALSGKIADILESDRTGRDPEVVLSEWAGHNIFRSRLGRWVSDLSATDGLARYLPKAFDSIYRWVFSPVPLSFLFDSPTVRVHGFYMGTDKVDHFFQQGYDYYQDVMRGRSEGRDVEAAVAAAVAHGVKQEHTYYGTAVSGIYSNGDLAANYAGMKFYRNLRHPVRIGDATHAPMFQKTPEGWRLRPGADPARLLEPFLSNHLDESLNPNRYRFSRKSLRSTIRKRCAQWTQFYSDRLDFVAPAGKSFAAKWFGEEYGYWLPPAQEVSIATE